MSFGKTYLSTSQPFSSHIWMSSAPHRKHRCPESQSGWKFPTTKNGCHGGGISFQDGKSGFYLTSFSGVWPHVGAWYWQFFKLSCHVQGDKNHGKTFNFTYELHPPCLFCFWRSGAIKYLKLWLFMEEIQQQFVVLCLFLGKLFVTSLWLNLYPFLSMTALESSVTNLESLLKKWFDIGEVSESSLSIEKQGFFTTHFEEYESAMLVHCSSSSFGEVKIAKVLNVHHRCWNNWSKTRGWRIKRHFRQIFSMDCSRCRLFLCFVPFSPSTGF